MFLVLVRLVGDVAGVGDADVVAVAAHCAGVGHFAAQQTQPFLLSLHV